MSLFKFGLIFLLMVFAISLVAVKIAGQWDKKHPNEAKSIEAIRKTW